MRIINLNSTPSARYNTTQSCVLIPGIGSVPVANPPADIYPDVGRDGSSIAAGHRATGWERTVRDGASVEVPTATEEIPPALPTQTLYERLRGEHAEGFAAFRAAFLQLTQGLQAAGHDLPNPLTFRDLSATLTGLGGDWLTQGMALRGLYDEVLYACRGDMQDAYSLLPELLADETLT